MVARAELNRRRHPFQSVANLGKPVAGDGAKLPCCQIAIVTRGRDVLAFENYAAGCRQSRAFGDGLELRGANGPRTHGKRRTSLLPTKWEAPLHVGQVRRAVILQ